MIFWSLPRRLCNTFSCYTTLFQVLLNVDYFMCSIYFSSVYMKYLLFSYFGLEAEEMFHFNSHNHEVQFLIKRIKSLDKCICINLSITDHHKCSFENFTV